MAYREVTMVEIKEVLRLWRAWTPKKRIAAQLSLDVKTVRRYVAAAQACGLQQAAPGEPAETPSDEQFAAVLAALAPDAGRPHGDSGGAASPNLGEPHRGCGAEPHRG